MKLVKFAQGLRYRRSQNRGYAHNSYYFEQHNCQIFHNCLFCYSQVVLILVQNHWLSQEHLHKVLMGVQKLSQEYPNDFPQIYLE